jgi:phage-related minor tail protein
MAARAKLAKAEGKNADAQRQEKALAAKVAEEQVRAQYESLRLNNGQLQLTAQQTAEMGKQVRLARAAATQAVVLKYEAQSAAERIAEGARAARELATQIERASKAYETFLNKTTNINDNTAGIRKQIEVLRAGGSTQDASAEGRNETAMRKVQREADELRAQQKALGADRTLTDTEITASQLAQEKALGQNLAATRLKNKELDKRKKPKALPKTAKDILDKEERSMSLKLDKSRALLGLSETEILYETKKYALMSKVQEQMVTMTDAEKASTMARIDGIAREMAAREEQQRLEQEVVDFQKELAETISSTFADNFMSIVDGTKSVAEAFKAMAADIVKHLFKVLIIQTMIRAMGGFMGSVAAPDSLMGNIGKGLMSYEAANGGVLNNGQVVPYANGGVVGGPTTFPMSGGRTGLMGEAGPEAIMPLKRGKDGKLGVQADGGSSSNVVIHQSFNFSANGDESVKKIIAEQAPAIANMTKQNILNDRRRGGQMRQAFG